MKTVKDEVLNLYNWVEVNIEKVDISKCGKDYTISIGDNYPNSLSFTISKDNTTSLFFNYFDITFIRGFPTRGRYQQYSSIIKELYRLVEVEYSKRESNIDTEIYRKYIKDIVDYESDNDFNFGEPIHTSFLPECSLNTNETYLVPMVLKNKERVFDGGRGTEYYEFEYIVSNPISKTLRIRDDFMSSGICPLLKNENG